MKNKTFCVIGLGYIGLPTAAMIASKGNKVFGFDTSKKVTVEIKSQQAPIIESKKPKLKVEVMKENKVTVSEKQHVINIMKMLIRENINLKNLTVKKDKLNNIIGEYITDNNITESQKAPVISKVIKVLEKRN